MALPPTTAQGNITVNGGIVSVNCAFASLLGFNVSGTWTGTLAFQASHDGVSFINLAVVSAGGTTGVTTTTVNGDWTAAVSGFLVFQVMATATITGTAVVTLNPSPAGTPPPPPAPSVFKTATATALGNTALWTPASGKKFRLMRYRLSVSYNGSLASAGILTVSMQDSTTDIAQTHSVFVPIAALSAGGPALYESGWIDLGGGVLSSTANNVLNINLGTALATGVVRVTCCGTEE